MEHFEESTNPIDVCIKGEAKKLGNFFEQNLLACLIDYLSNLSEDDSNNSAPRLSREVLVRQSRSQLQSTIEAHLRYDIDIKSGNIRVVVPSKITDSTLKTFVFNLGTLNFISVPLENRKNAAGTHEYCQVKQRLRVYNFDGKVYFKYGKFRDFLFLHAIGIQKR